MIRNIYGDRFLPTKKEMVDAVEFNLPEYTPLDGLICSGRLMKNAIIETIERGCYLGARAWWEIQTCRFGWAWRRESTGHHTHPITGQDLGPLFRYWRIGFFYIRHWWAAEELKPPDHPNCLCTIYAVDEPGRNGIKAAEKMERAKKIIKGRK